MDKTKHTEAMRHEQGNSRIVVKGGSDCNRLVQIFGTVSVVTIFGTVSVVTTFGTVSVVTTFGTVSVVTIFGTVSVVTTFHARGADEVFPSAGLVRGVFWRAVTGVPGATCRSLFRRQALSGVKHYNVHRSVPRHIFVQYNQQDAPVISNYLFFQKAVHVSDGLSVSHQELKTASTATVYVKQLLLPVAIWDETELQFHLIPDSSSCLTYTVAVDAILSS